VTVDVATRGGAWERLRPLHWLLLGTALATQAGNVQVHPDSLAGRRLALPAHAELDRLAVMLRECEAEVVRFPLMAILEVEHPAPIHDWLRSLVAQPFADAILLTGQGAARSATTT
jgi:uroporphyrinogen-III synthase